MRHLIRKFTADDSGAAMMEYALLAALIALAAIGAVTLVGQEVGNTFNSIAGQL